MTSYEEAGVNLDAADELVDRIGWRVTSTWTEDVVGGFGGFAAGLQIPAGFEVPVLMMSTDGVGTKADIARRTGMVEGLGFDLVAMVADDLSSGGAMPLAMQDYIAVGYLDVDRTEMLVESITDACADNDVALLGGETAEHPGGISGDRFDLAGTALGIVELGDEIDNDRVAVDDVIIGVHSPNLRTSGFALVRALIVDQLDLEAPFPGSDRTFAEVVAALRPVPAPAPVAFEAVDRYVGAPLAEGESSLTVRFVLEPDERTLTDDETERYRGALVRVLGDSLGIRIR